MALPAASETTGWFGMFVKRALIALLCPNPVISLVRCPEVSAVSGLSSLLNLPGAAALSPQVTPAWRGRQCGPTRGSAEISSQQDRDALVAPGVPGALRPFPAWPGPCTGECLALQSHRGGGTAELGEAEGEQRRGRSVPRRVRIVCVPSAGPACSSYGFRKGVLQGPFIYKSIFSRAFPQSELCQTQ